MTAANQLGLFDTDRSVNDQQSAFARTRMREMIERLKATSIPFWRDAAAVILDDGAFQRAMRLVPPDEAQALWADFDKEMQRVYAIWAATDSSSSPGPSGR